jgi:glutathione S-transferase
MSADPIPLSVYHIPQSRSSSVVRLLEELGIPYDVKLLDINAKDQLKPEYLAVNPMGKVPAIKHGDAVVTEQVAIHIYLADYFAEKGLAPGLTDPLRGPYLRWFVYYAACFEPAIVDRALKREPGGRMMSPYGSFETVMDALTTQLAKGPYFLGEKFLALDVLWATGLGWTTKYGMVPLRPEIEAYLGRVSSRPAFQRAEAQDTKLLKSLKA